MEDNHSRPPGTRLIWFSVALLAALAAVAFYVSYEAQFGFVYAVKARGNVAAAEALIPDAGMLICAMLALAMAVQGRSAKVARFLVMGFAALSAVMNYEAADSLSVHSVTVYVMPAVAFAVCTDLVVSVIRRFYYGAEESSPWSAAGRLIRVVTLYGLRLVLDPRETGRGLRQMVLDAAPLPGAPKAPGAAAVAADDPGKPPLVSEAWSPRIAAAVRADREPGLAAARKRAEQDLTEKMAQVIRLGYSPLGRNELSRLPELLALGSDATRKRIARRALDGAEAAFLDGADGHVNGSRS